MGTAFAFEPRQQAPRSGAAGSGLVKQVTSDTAYISQPYAQKCLNRQRRLRLMRSRVITAAQQSQRIGTSQGGRSFASMLTLTYRDADGYQPRHISEYLKKVRQWLDRRGISVRYQWVMELQNRGAPHYHVLLWLPRRIKVPMPDRSGMWAHGSSRAEWARSPVGYLVKYATKGDDSQDLPKGARLYGCAGLDLEGRVAVHRAGLPRWLREVSSGRCRRVPHVGFVDGDGVAHRSPYVVRWTRNEFGLWRCEVLKRESQC